MKCLLLLCFLAVAFAGKFCFPTKWRFSMEVMSTQPKGGHSNKVMFRNFDYYVDNTMGAKRYKYDSNVVPGMHATTVIIGLEAANLTYLIDATAGGQPKKCYKFPGFQAPVEACSADPGWAEYYSANVGGYAMKSGTKGNLWANTGMKMGGYAQAFLYKEQGVEGYLPAWIRIYNNTQWGQTSSIEFYNNGPLASTDFDVPALCKKAEPFTGTLPSIGFSV
eukprot:NODE_1557_length_814_cov_72.072780_g1509_i0.p1 GENE.NODE_1557_length_814_cov_72.072780_g1509_i0~~NODE_1557_length_814_cov_72.072780_g1509_i0.p1  ORF type:complete len:221 (+),score=50.31 NODE_1557_length_814_cov_72.072780_g1509_i0:59-721(+)